ncbi:MAG TPA: glycosyltransferase, partial [Candidatus Melainabacteria bacterium]|nr:glycosyltransferase [Candidatus Melainabacteria bacterium]
MRVLISEFDLYQSVGGGQTVYRRLIETFAEIHFYYLIKEEKDNTERPLNAHPIRYKEVYDIERLYSASLTEDLPPRWTCREFIEASNIAASVSGFDFDIAEAPDYKQHGLFLRSAFLQHKVKCRRFVLSLHGSISTSLRLNWGTDNDEPCIQFEELERLQYSCMDIRYGISKKYIAEWIERAGIESLYLHPMRFLAQPEPKVAPSSNQPPSLNFVGRTERRKGPDIFIEMARWLSHEEYREVNIIGPPSIMDGIESTDFLRDYQKNRAFEVNIHPCSTQEELTELFSSKAIVILPSRYDTLNLVVLESLFAGCPTAIGSGAAVCQFLDENYPEVPFVKIDIDNWYACLPEIKEIRNNYDRYRYSLVEAIKKSKPRISGPTLTEIYQADPITDIGAIKQLHHWYLSLMAFYESPESIGLLTQIHVLALEVSSRLNGRVLSGPAKKLIRENVLLPMFEQDKICLDQAFISRQLASEYINIYLGREITEKQIEQKLKSLKHLDTRLRLDRGRRWAEIARLERLRDNTEIAAAYDLRVMRLCDEDKLNRLPQVISDLSRCGYAREAEVAQAMFATGEDRFAACKAIIEKSQENHRQYQPGE